MILGHTCTIIVKVFTCLEEEGRGEGRGKRSRREKREQDGEEGAGERGRKAGR